MLAMSNIQAIGLASGAFIACIIVTYFLNHATTKAQLSAYLTEIKTVSSPDNKGDTSNYTYLTTILLPYLQNTTNTRNHAVATVNAELIAALNKLRDSGGLVDDKTALSAANREILRLKLKESDARLVRVDTKRTEDDHLRNDRDAALAKLGDAEKDLAAVKKTLEETKIAFAVFRVESEGRVGPLEQKCKDDAAVKEMRTRLGGITAERDGLVAKVQKQEQQMASLQEENAQLRMARDQADAMESDLQEDIVGLEIELDTCKTELEQSKTELEGYRPWVPYFGLLPQLQDFVNNQEEFGLWKESRSTSATVGPEPQIEANATVVPANVENSAPPASLSPAATTFTPLVHLAGSSGQLVGVGNTPTPTPAQVTESETREDQIVHRATTPPPPPSASQSSSPSQATPPHISNTTPCIHVNKPRGCTKGTQCPFHHNFQGIACRHVTFANCPEGGSCVYLHIPDKDLCQHVNALYGCKYGGSCRKSHKNQDVACRKSARGECDAYTRGSRCLFVHADSAAGVGAETLRPKGDAVRETPVRETPVQKTPVQKAPVPKENVDIPLLKGHYQRPLMGIELLDAMAEESNASSQNEEHTHASSPKNPEPANGTVSGYGKNQMQAAQIKPGMAKSRFAPASTSTASTAVGSSTQAVPVIESVLAPSSKTSAVMGSTNASPPPPTQSTATVSPTVPGTSTPSVPPIQSVLAPSSQMMGSVYASSSSPPPASSVVPPILGLSTLFTQTQSKKGKEPIRQTATTVTHTPSSSSTIPNHNASPQATSNAAQTQPPAIQSVLSPSSKALRERSIAGNDVSASSVASTSVSSGQSTGTPSAGAQQQQQNKRPGLAKSRYFC